MDTTIFPRFSGLFLAGAILLWASPSMAANTAADVWARTVMHEDGSRTLSKRDYNSQIIEAKTYDRNDVLIMKRIFQIDAKGDSKRGFIFDGDNTLIYRVGFTYDEIDRLKETILYDAGGNVVSRQYQSYDERGRELKPKLVNYAGSTTAPGQIRPAAAIAAPGSDEPILQPTQAQAQAQEAAAAAAAGKKEKKGIFSFFRKRKKK